MTGGHEQSIIQRLSHSHFYVLVDAQMPVELWTRRLELLVESGVDILQLRDKRLADRDLLERARRIRQITRGTPVIFIMNDRADLALLAQADGVHVGQEELRPSDVRRIVGPEPLIGVSTHSAEQAQQAILGGASYIGVGPTFPSLTKRFDRYPGLDLLQQICGGGGMPAFAIGGINLRNLPSVLATGCRRIAVSGAVWGADDPVSVVDAMKGLIRAADARTAVPPRTQTAELEVRPDIQRGGVSHAESTESGGP